MKRKKLGTKENENGEEVEVTTTIPSKWYKWENNATYGAKKELDDLKIKLNNNEYYLVNYESGEVIFSVGYKNDNNEIIYRLSEMEKLQNEQ